MPNWLKWIEEKLVNLGGFLKAFIYPLATCFFAILNYTKMRQLLLENKHPNWATFCLILSVIYILFTLGFGIYWVIIAIRGSKT
jgi:hypothetical protein